MAFQVFRRRAGRALVLTVSIVDGRLVLDGHQGLVASLAREGVTDPDMKKHWPLNREYRGADAIEVANALLDRFNRDSAYEVEQNENGT
jgi:hypothetical protein